MRYYLIHDSEEIVVDLVHTHKISNSLYSLEFHYLDEDKKKFEKIYYIRKLATKYYLSPDMIHWKKIPNQQLPQSVLNVDKVYKMYRGYKPSGLGSGDTGALVTQMPGKVVKILAKEGEEVSKGDTLIILEAMKMENEIKSSMDGVVKKIHVSEGGVLDQGILMMELE